MWDVQNEGCSRHRMFGMWYVRMSYVVDVECFGCEVFWIWDACKILGYLIVNYNFDNERFLS